MEKPFKTAERNANDKNVTVTGNAVFWQLLEGAVRHVLGEDGLDHGESKLRRRWFELIKPKQKTRPANVSILSLAANV